MSKTDSRGKGLAFVREVKTILQSLGHETEGPAYFLIHTPKVTPMGEKIIIPVQCHKDFFGIWDLISWHKVYGVAFHQVSIYEKRQTKINEIIKKGMSGNVWGRCKQGRNVTYRTYSIDKEGKVTEEETYFLNEIKKLIRKKENV
jgi:hypothetical protein